MTSADLLDKNLISILPFVPLTLDGKKHEIIEEVIRRLKSADDIMRKELLELTEQFASLAFGKDDQENQEWLKWRFAMERDIFFDTPITKMYMEMGRAEAEEELLKLRVEKDEELSKLQNAKDEELLKLQFEKAKELAELQFEQIERARNTFIMLVQVRFPRLAPVAKLKVRHIDDIHILEDITEKFSSARKTRQNDAILFLSDDQEIA
jgi:hypothetical protein